MKGPDPDKIGPMFDSIAADYDRLNHILSLGTDRSWRRRAIPSIADKVRAQDILDAACGTGDFSIAIAEASHPRTLVTGADLSDGMLDVMRRKVCAKGLQDRINTVKCNCETLPYGECSFDRVTIAFGIRNFENREAALKEFLRVLRPGGKLVILELSVPSNPVLRWGYNLYFKHMVPLIGGIVSGDRAAYRYLPASVIKFPGPEEWKATMESCGYGNVCHESFTFGLCRMYTGTK